MRASSEVGRLPFCPMRTGQDDREGGGGRSPRRDMRHCTS
jgi:hypothetical protein